MILTQIATYQEKQSGLLLNILGAIAQFETEIPAARQMDGIVKAKERGGGFW
ncbi:MAG: recombinase family protein [Cyanobacteria bacterium J06621_8]